DLSSERSKLVHEQQAGGLELLDLLHYFGKIRQHKIVVPLANPRGPHQERSAAGLMSRLRVLPLVADHIRSIEIDVPFESRFQQQAILGFATRAMVRLVMGANQDVIQR